MGSISGVFIEAKFSAVLPQMVLRFLLPMFFPSTL